MKSGIFSNSLDLSSLLDQPEHNFKKRLRKNPVYPFAEIGENIYVLTITCAKFWIGIVLCSLLALITILMFTLVNNVGESDIQLEMIAFPFFAFIGFLLSIIKQRHDRTYVLDVNEKMYEYYRGDKLVYRGHFHNIYIRLKGVNSGAGTIYYTVILNGFHLHEEAISATTTKHAVMAKLAKKLAQRLDLNFFDYKDKSRTHVVRHRCPYRPTCPMDV